MMSYSRRRMLLSLSGFGTALVRPQTSRSEATPSRGGTINLLLAAEPPTITTIAQTAYNSVYASPKVTEGLLTYDFDLRPLPQLAIAWSISADGLRYEFRLRPGVKWHDGQKFTSADAAYSIAAIKEVHPRGRSTFGNLIGIETPDPLTLVLVLSRPAPYLISALAASETPIVPKHLYEGTRPETNPVNNAPIGTGPFIFKAWARGSHILLERNPDYWDAPKPYVDQVVIRIMPDIAARAAAIETGQIQLAPATPIPLSDLERFEHLPNVALERRGYQYANSISRVEFNLDRPCFQDVRVRRAFAHVIDRKVIHQTINYGYGDVIPGPFSTNLTQFYYGNLRTYPIDLARAEALLDASGLKRGEDGIRLRLTHDYVPSGESYRRGADYIRQALAKVGIAVSVRSQDFAAYTKRVYTDRDFDFTFNGMSNLFDPTVGVQRLYWSKNFRPGVPFSNGAHYSNPKVDALLEAAAVEMDPKTRYQQFLDFQNIVVDDVPDIGIVTQPDLTLFDRKVAGHTVGAEGVAGNLANVHFLA